MFRRRRRADEAEEVEVLATEVEELAEEIDALAEEPITTRYGPVVIDYATIDPQGSGLYVRVDEQPQTAVAPPAAQPAVQTALAPTRPTSTDEVQESIEAVRLLTALLVGGAIEGADQLVTRLRAYEQELEVLAAAQEAQRLARGQTGQVLPAEDELDRLRYALVGFVFDAQTRLGKGIYTAARLADAGLETAGDISRPFRNFFLFRPITSRIEKRVDGLIAYGRESIEHWTATGRDLEPRSRALATRTYAEIVDEFINMLAENEEIKELVQTQSISLVAEVRDNVRGRTVSADSVVEELVRRVLRRAPREDLPEPPPEVQRWAGIRVTEESDTPDNSQSNGPNTENRR